MHESISPLLTLEFLSTLQIDKHHSLSFHLYNEKYIITYEHLGEALEIPANGLYGYKDEPLFNEYKAWEDLTRERRFNLKIAGDSSLVSFMHKYLHRFISYSILARGENHGNLRKL